MRDKTKEQVKAPLVDRILGRAYAHKAKGHQFDADLLLEAATALIERGEKGEWSDAFLAETARLGPKDDTPVACDAPNTKDNHHEG